MQCSNKNLIYCLCNRTRNNYYDYFFLEKKSSLIVNVSVSFLHIPSNRVLQNLYKKKKKLKPHLVSFSEFKKNLPKKLTILKKYSYI